MKELTTIFMSQIQLLHKKAEKLAEEGKALELSDLRKLESLTKAWRTYQGAEIDAADETLSDMTSEELKAVIARLKDEDEL